MTIAFAPFTDLVFVHMPGCEACEAAMPELVKFEAARPSMMVVKIRADGPMVERLLGRLKIEATPTYVVRINGRGVAHVGAMTSKALAKWVDAIIDRETGEG